MTDIGSKLKTPALVKVETPGTAVRLETSAEAFTAGKTVVIQALSTNTSEIAIGDANVKAKTGTQASPERRGIGLASKNIISIDINDSAQIWVDAITAKDGVTYLVLEA